MKAPLRIKLIVILTSVTLLCYEVTLIRVYAIIQWQNFFSTIISMAMLGFGISGSLLFILKKKANLNTSKLTMLCLTLYPVTLFLGFVISCKIPFNPFLLGHDSIEILYLLITLICIIVPFIFGASIFGILIQDFNIHKLYSLNLIGSGLGAITVIITQFLLHPFISLVLITYIAFLTAIIYSSFFGKEVLIKITILSILSAASVAISFNLLDLEKVSEFKPISQTLSTKNAKILYERFSPFGLTQVVEADGLRSFSGLSIISSAEVPLQKRIYFDGDGSSSVIPFNGDFNQVSFLADMTSALTFNIREITSTLILGSGGGEGILRSLYFNSISIDAVEINPVVVKLMKNELSNFSGGIYLHPSVNIIEDDIRSYLSNTTKRYSLIDLSFNDSFSSAASGVNALTESYLYTVESFERTYDKLTKDGLLSITRWTVDPPRDNIKLIATAIKALRNRGINTPERHLAAIRSLQTLTLLISKNPFTSEEIDRIKKFSKKNLFDVVFYPGIKSDEPNLYVRLESPFYYNSAIKLLSDRNSKYIKEHTFNIEPATDNRPYFYNFFKLKTLKHIRSYNANWIPVTDWGYLIIVLLLIFAVILSTIGILLPVKLSSSHPINKDVILYFSFIALGYFFIQIALIQKSILYVGNPIYSASSIISGLLIFSGIGSHFSDKVKNKRNMILYSTLSIGAALLLYLFLYNLFAEVTGNWHISGKIALMLLSLSPLGFLMGIPFPRGLSIIKNKQPHLLPWAWGINGFFSVISILITSILSILLGFKAVLTLACLLYLMAGITSKRLHKL